MRNTRRNAHALSWFTRPAVWHGWYAILIVFTAVASAEEAYVVDKLLMGIHEARDLSSTILKVVPTASRVEILARDGGLAKVRDEDGVEGWVDLVYLMKDEPASIKLRALEARYEELQRRFAALEASVTAPTSSNNDSGTAAADELEALLQENTRLKSDLSADKVRITELEKSIKQLQDSAAHATSGDGTVTSELEKANLKLKRQLEAALQKNKQLSSREPTTPGNRMRPSSGQRWPTPMLVGLIAVLLVAFGLGMYLMDFLARRRHGGFRV